MTAREQGGDVDVAAILATALRERGWLDSGDAEDAAREIAPLVEAEIEFWRSNTEAVSAVARQFQANVLAGLALADEEDARVAEFNARQAELDRTDPRPDGFPRRHRISGILPTTAIRAALGGDQ